MPISGAKSYRLNRITALGYGTIREVLTEDVERYLKMMIDCAPQFAINDDVEICVKLNQEGIKLFNRIYYGILITYFNSIL